MRSVDNLVELYFTSVGRNSKLLLNVPPTRDGTAAPDRRGAAPGNAGRRLDALFAEDRYPDAAAGRSVTVSTADLREDIARGQSVAAYRLEGRVDGAWRVLSRGTTIGHRKLDRFAPVAITGARLTVEDAVGPVGNVPVRLRLARRAGRCHLPCTVTDLQHRLATALAGRYTIERELGQGGMAMVFLAHDLRHDRQVALKVLRPEIAAEIGAERFLREIRIAAGLTHPHILPVYDSGEAGGLLYYVMPYMEGRVAPRPARPRARSCRSTRRSGSPARSPPRSTTPTASGVVHRDIKPENILLHEGAALVADFGIGKALSGAGGALTQTGLAVGTPAYMSPEQAVRRAGRSTAGATSTAWAACCTRC